VKDARIDLRLTSEQRSTIERAAEISGSSLAGFAITHLMEDALSIIARSKTMLLNDEDWRLFQEALAVPDGPKWEQLRDRPRVWDAA